MSNFHARVSEVTIEMDGLHITTVSAPDTKEAAPDEAQIGDFHMSLFTAAEWIELSGLIETAIREVTGDAAIRARGQA
jgi:hypothetical protein